MNNGWLINWTKQLTGSGQNSIKTSNDSFYHIYLNFSLNLNLIQFSNKSTFILFDLALILFRLVYGAGCTICRSVLIERVMDQQLKSWRTLHNFVVQYWVPGCPSPWSKQLTSSFYGFLYCGGIWQGWTWAALYCAWTFLVPFSTNWWLSFSQYCIRLATDISSRVLQIIITGSRKIKMRNPSLTPMRPRRTPILLHNNRRPVLINRSRISNEQTFPTSPDIINPTTTIIGSQHGRKCITRSPSHPQFLPILSPTMVDRIKWRIHTSISIFGWVPRLECFCITSPAIAVPEMWWF